MSRDSKLGTIGIDLGTWNSSAAVALGEDNVIMVESGYGKHQYGKTHPSFVYFDPSGKPREVGIEALHHLGSGADSERVVWGVKRYVGMSYNAAKRDEDMDRFQYQIGEGPDKGIEIKVGKKTYKPTDILTFILKKIREETENPVNKHIGGIEYKQCVVSVPANFGAVRTGHITKAAQDAGFSEVDTIAEPTAAAIAYCRKLQDKEAKILAFDMGAGTLDISFMQLYREDGFLIPGEISISGAEHLGGLDMDGLISAHLIQKHDLAEIEEDLQLRGMLQYQVEQAKVQLSKKDQERLELPGRGEAVWITRDELVDIVRPVLERTRKLFRTALQKSGTSARDLAHVIFVGGPTYMPCIRRLVREELQACDAKIELLEEIDSVEKCGFPINPMDCVAQGAALKAAGICEPLLTTLSQGYGTIFRPVSGLPDYYHSIIAEGAYFPIKAGGGIRFGDTETRMVRIPLVVKKADESTPENVRYQKLLPLPLFITPDGDRPSVGISVSVVKDRSMLVELTHRQSGQKVQYKHVELMEDEDITLQDHTPPDSSDSPIGESEPPSWDKEHCERLIRATNEALALVNNPADQDIKSLVMRLNAAMRKVSCGNQADANEICPYMANRIAELINLLLSKGQIDENEFRDCLAQLSQIAEM